MNNLEKELGFVEELDKEPTEVEIIKYNSIKQKIDDAEKSNVPYLVQDSDNLSVVGDPNKTKKKERTFVLEYRVPKETKVDGKIDGDFKIVTKTYENVFISGRANTGVIGCLVTMMPYFYKPMEDGTVVDYEPNQIKEMVKALRYPEFNKTLFLLIENVLGISSELAEKATPSSAIDFLTTLLSEFPEVINEAYSFFQ